MHSSFRWLIAACTIVVLALTTSVNADDETVPGKGKGKGKDSKSRIIQIDLGTLPPELAKALQAYSAGPMQTEQPKAQPAKAQPSKGQTAKQQPNARKSPFNTSNLPPGLASKPADHPGRVHWLLAQSGAAPGKEKSKKSGYE